MSIIFDNLVGKQWFHHTWKSHILSILTFILLYPTYSSADETLYFTVVYQKSSIPHTVKEYCVGLNPTTAIRLHKAYADDVIGQITESAEHAIPVCLGDSMVIFNGSNYYCNEHTNLEWRKVRVNVSWTSYNVNANPVLPTFIGIKGGIGESLPERCALPGEDTEDRPLNFGQPACDKAI